MHANELLRVQRIGEVLDSLPQHDVLLSNVQAGIDVLCFDPFDITDVDEANHRTVGNKEPIGIFPPGNTAGLQTCQHGLQLALRQQCRL